MGMKEKNDQREVGRKSEQDRRERTKRLNKNITAEKMPRRPWRDQLWEEERGTKERPYSLKSERGRNHKRL